MYLQERQNPIVSTQQSQSSISTPIPSLTVTPTPVVITTTPTTVIVKPSLSPTLKVDDSQTELNKVKEELKKTQAEAKAARQDADNAAGWIMLNMLF